MVKLTTFQKAPMVKPKHFKEVGLREGFKNVIFTVWLVYHQTAYTSYQKRAGRNPLTKSGRAFLGNAWFADVPGTNV